MTQHEGGAVSWHVVCAVYRADLQCDVIKPVTKATVGELYCAYFLEDKQWYRAKVVSIVSATHVSYYRV